MTPTSPVRRTLCMLLALLLAAPVAFAQTSGTRPTTPVAAPKDSTTTPAPAAPPSPVSGIRGKISAGDLLSAESILEVHREKNGEDAGWLTGLSWLARGALLLGDFDKAKRYAAEVRSRSAEKIAGGADLTTDSGLETALGAAIEVEAQWIARERGKRQAAEYLRTELARIKGPAALRSRLNKRINVLELTGKPAPELAIEDYLGDRPSSLASMRGKPVLLFLWAEWCADCRVQAASLARVKRRHADEGLQVVALTATTPRRSTAYGRRLGWTACGRPTTRTWAACPWCSARNPWSAMAARARRRSCSWTAPGSCAATRRLV